MPNNLTILISVYISYRCIAIMLLVVSSVFCLAILCKEMMQRGQSEKGDMYCVRYFRMIVSPFRVVRGQLRVILCVRFDEFSLILLHTQHLFVLYIVCPLSFQEQEILLKLYAIPGTYEHVRRDFITFDRSHITEYSSECLPYISSTGGGVTQTRKCCWIGKIYI